MVALPGWLAGWLAAGCRVHCTMSIACLAVGGGAGESHSAWQNAISGLSNVAPFAGWNEIVPPLWNADVRPVEQSCVCLVNKNNNTDSINNGEHHNFSYAQGLKY